MPETTRVEARVMLGHLVELTGPDYRSVLHAAAEWLGDHPTVSACGITVRFADGACEAVLSVQEHPDDGILDEEAISVLATREPQRFTVAGAQPPAGYVRFDPAWVVTPGQILMAFINDFNVSPTTVAHRCGWPDTQGRRLVERILDGIEIVTPEVASSLFIGTQIPARVWLTAENGYRASVRASARQAE